MFLRASNSKQHQYHQRHFHPRLLPPDSFLCASSSGSPCPLNCFLPASLPFSRLHRLWSNFIDVDVMVSKVAGRSCCNPAANESAAKYLPNVSILITKEVVEEAMANSLALLPRSRPGPGPWACRCERRRDQGPHHHNPGRDAANHFY